MAETESSQNIIPAPEVTSTVEKKNFVDKIIAGTKNALSKLKMNIKGKTTPSTEVVNKPAKTPTEIPVAPGETITRQSVKSKTDNKTEESKKPGKVEGNSTPSTEIVNKPAKTPTEIPVAPGETITSSINTAFPGISTGGTTLPNVVGLEVPNIPNINF